MLRAAPVYHVANASETEDTVPDLSCGTPFVIPTVGTVVSVPI